MALFGRKVFIEVLVKNLKIKIILDFGWLLNPMAGWYLYERRSICGDRGKAAM